MDGKAYIVEYNGVVHKFLRSSNKCKKIGNLMFQEVDGVMIITDGRGGIVRERFDVPFKPPKQPLEISSEEYRKSRSMPIVNSKGLVEE